MMAYAHATSARWSQGKPTFQNRANKNVPTQVVSATDRFTTEIFIAMLTSNFLTTDYLIDLIKVIPDLIGGRPHLLDRVAHTLRPDRLRSLPLRMCRDICIEVDGSIAAK